LAQKTNFCFEYVIGDDCSTDDTGKIVKEYALKHPNIIKVIAQKNNVGAIENARRTRESCKGKYVAICEGDDYWIDEYKLQKQVNFLEENPDFSAVSHQTLVKIEDIQKSSEKFYNCNSENSILFYKGKKSVLKFHDFFHSYYIHINSLMYRRHIIEMYDLNNTAIFDHGFILLLASKGKIKIMPDIMSVYRRHPGGKSASINPEIAFKAQLKWVTDIKKLLGHKFFLGYHYQTSKIIYYYALNHPAETNNNKLTLFYNYMKNLLLTLLLFPGNIKSKLKQIKKVIIRLVN
jgi:glycosyltransferase involved in cell wall biosynthesis